MNNNDFFEKALHKAQELGEQIHSTIEEQRDQLSPQVKDALNKTQAQTEEALGHLGGFLRAGAQKAKEAADAAAQAIRDDINKRP